MQGSGSLSNLYSDVRLFWRILLNAVISCHHVKICQPQKLGNILRKWCLARNNVEFCRKLVTYLVLKRHLTQLVLVFKQSFCLTAAQELFFFLRCFTCDVSSELCSKTKRKNWIRACIRKCTISDLYGIRRTLAKLDLQPSYSAIIGMLESLLVSSADCHGNHTVLSILVLKIGAISNNWWLPYGKTMLPENCEKIVFILLRRVLPNNYSFESKAK